MWSTQFCIAGVLIRMSEYPGGECQVVTGLKVAVAQDSTPSANTETPSTNEFLFGRSFESDMIAPKKAPLAPALSPSSMG